MYASDVTLLMLYLQVATIALCFIASRAAVRGFHGNAPILSWWSRALLSVLMIYFLRIVYMPFHDKLSAVVVLESLFSNMGNMCMLALASAAEGKRVRLSKLSVQENALWISATVVPVILGVVWSAMPPLSAVVPVLAFAIRATTALFSAYVMLVVGAVLYEQAQVLKKTQLYLFGSYGLYQIGVLAVPLFARVSSTSELHLESVYLAASMFFKVGVTISLVAVSSQLVRRSQQQAIWGSAASSDEVAVFMVDDSGPEYEVVRNTLTKHNISSRRVERESTHGESLLAPRSAYSMAIINRTLTNRDKELLSMLVNSAVVCVIVARTDVEWRPMASLPSAMCDRYVDNNDLVQMTESWIRRDIRSIAAEVARRVPVEIALPMSR